jgi:PAS domain S-box-containing protein
MLNELLPSMPEALEATAKNIGNVDLKSLLHQLPAAVSIVTGPSFIIAMANPKALALWGKTYEEVINRPCFEVFPELDGQGFDSIMHKVYETGEQFVAHEIPMQLVRNGQLERLYINLTYNPYRTDEGAIIGIIATGIDVTEQVKARQALVESEERLRIAIESVEMGTWEYNPVTNRIYCSEKTKQLFGLEQERVLTLEMMMDCIMEADRPKVLTAIQQALASEVAVNHDVEFSLINRINQQQIIIKAKGKTIHKEGVMHRFIGTVLDVTQEARAREEQRKLRTLIDNSVELMSILELDGKNSYINNAGMDMLGFDNWQQVLDTPISSLHTPEDAAFVSATVLPIVMTSGSWSGVMKVRHLKTGEVFPVFNNTIRIDDPVSGRPMAVGAVMRDMRPELAAQKLVADSEQQLRNVMEQAPYPIFILKGEEMVLDIANQALLDLWQIDEKAIGKKFLDILPEMKDQGFMELLLDVYHHNKSHYGFEMPAVFNRTDGTKEVFYFNFVYQPFKELDGVVTGVLIMATDVTGQVVAKNKLLKSEATLSLAVNTARFGVFEIDFKNQSLVHSPRTAEIFGLNPARQWPLDFMLNMYHPDDLPGREEAFERAVLTGDLFYEIRILWPDNSVHWIRLNGKVISEDGSPVSAVGTIMDITQEKRTAEMLEEMIRVRTEELQIANKNLAHSNQQLEQFAHVASHDMKEPIRKVAMFTDRLESELEAVLTPAARTFIEKVKKASLRLTNMVEGVLNYSSIHATETKTELVNLYEVISQIESDLELVIQQKAATLMITNLPVITATPFLMHQLFYNLINNALKFSKAEVTPIITLSAQPYTGTWWKGYAIDGHKEYWEITLQDNGIGFSPESAEKIFTTFTRLHSKDQYEGTGLGLSLCRNIVEKHNGFIKAFGKEGEGAQFIMLFPA